MLSAITSKLLGNIWLLRRKSDMLGVVHSNYYLIVEKAEEQFGKDNVEGTILPMVVRDATFYCNRTNGLFNNFGNVKKRYELMIHWSSVIVKNEEDEFTTIRDLFCKISFKENGTFNNMTFARTTYSQSEWNARYCHSHLHSLDWRDPVKFTSMCLGTGPINDTISSLHTENYSEETLDVFFWELDKVVHVESLSGVPYIRMSSIKKVAGERADLRLVPCPKSCKEINDFCQSFFGAVSIPLGFEKGKYVSGCTFLEFAILVTNYYNKYQIIYPRACAALRRVGFGKTKYVLKDGAVYTLGEANTNMSWRSLNVPDIRFRGRSYPFTVIEDTDTTITAKWLVNVGCVKYIQRLYLALVNMKFCKSEYGKEEAIKGDKERLYAFYASHGICSTDNKDGARTEDSIFYI